MRPGRMPALTLNLTRRALARRLASAAAVIGIGHGAAARNVANPAWYPGSASMRPISRPPPPAQRDKSFQGRSTVAFTAPLVRVGAAM